MITISELQLPGEARCRVHLDVAQHAIRAGQLELAAHALREAGTPQLEADAALWDVLSGRLEAADGRPEAALARAGDRGGQWALVRAHALCALGREGEARSELLAICERDAIQATLEQVAGLGGPAAPLARRMREERSVYR